MKKKIFRLVSLLLILSLVLTPLCSTSAAAASGPSVTSGGAFILDCQTGKEIWSLNADTSLVPASLTKVMTVYLVYEAIASGEISKDTIVPISRNVYTKSRDYEYSNIPLNTDEVYTVDEILAATICYSACAAAVALAELLSGTEAEFVAKMNSRAEELGLTAVFYDCYGKANSNRITPRSMAYLAYYLITEYPDYLNYSSKANFDFHGKNYETTNDLLLGKYEYTGTVDGIKTGTSLAAGYCLCTSVTQNGNRIITVTMRSTTAVGRYTDSIKLINYGFKYINRYLDLGYRYVSPSAFDIYVDGELTDVSAYLIDDSNYFRLRDLAYVLSGGGSSFEVTYDVASGAVVITTDSAYTALGTELQAIPNFKAMALSNSPLVYANGQTVTMSTYLIEDSNYVKLRDVAALVGFDVEWDDSTRSVLINSKAA